MDTRDAIIHILMDELANTQIILAKTQSVLDVYYELYQILFKDCIADGTVIGHVIAEPNGRLMQITGVTVRVGPPSDALLNFEEIKAINDAMASWVGVPATIDRPIKVIIQGINGQRTDIKCAQTLPARFVYSGGVHPQVVTAQNAEHIIRKLVENYTIT